MPPLVVFDTNVLLSAIGWNGAPRRCVDLARQGLCRSVTCGEIVDELNEVLRRRLSFTIEQAAETGLWLLSFSEVVTITCKRTGLCADLGDDKIIECALVAKASTIVSGDRRHLLTLGDVEGVRIVTPAQWAASLGHTASDDSTV